MIALVIKEIPEKAKSLYRFPFYHIEEPDQSAVLAPLPPQSASSQGSLAGTWKTEFTNQKQKRFSNNSSFTESQGLHELWITQTDNENN